MPITKRASKPGDAIQFVAVRSEWPVLPKEEFMPEWFENRNGVWDPSALSIHVSQSWNEVAFTAYGRTGNALRGGLTIKLENFEPLIATLLAHLWDVPEEDLRNIKALAAQVERQKKNIAVLEDALLALEDALPDPDMYEADDELGLRIRQAEQHLDELLPVSSEAQHG